MGNKVSSVASKMPSSSAGAEKPKRAPWKPTGSRSSDSTPSGNRFSSSNPNNIKSDTNSNNQHKNPYYTPEKTVEPEKSLHEAFGGAASASAAVYRQNQKPLGTPEHIKIEEIDVTVMQSKNESVHDFVQSMGAAITQTSMPGAMPSIEEQIMVLKFLGIDPNKVMVLEKQLEELQMKEREKTNAEPVKQPEPSPMSETKRKPRIDINIDNIGVSNSEKQRLTNTRDSASFWRDQIPENDHFSELVALSHLSRSSAYSHDAGESAEPIFRHDGLQNLPTSNARATGPPGSRTIPGLITSEELNFLITNGSEKLPETFPITNPSHIKLLLNAVAAPKPIPVKTDERKFKLGAQRL